MGNFSCFCCRLLTFSKLTYSKKFFQEHYQSVYQFEARSRLTFCRSCSGSKLFAEVNSRQQKSPFARKEVWTVGPRALIFHMFIKLPLARKELKVNFTCKKWCAIVKIYYKFYFSGWVQQVPDSEKGENEVDLIRWSWVLSYNTCKLSPFHRTSEAKIIWVKLW